jgi:predicted methyltransferase
VNLRNWLFSAVMLAACSGAARNVEPSAIGAAVVPPGHDGFREAVAGPQRSDAEKARDAYRHPVETLEFFGVRPDMTVVGGAMARRRMVHVDPGSGAS